ncbi:ATP-binding protein OS=Streptomyces microflavus OX=1919 GN=G3I39_01325 PE=4 SV=1 [Streptomyces microflavus]
MKKSAAKSLGVAVLGAAFAADRRRQRPPPPPRCRSTPRPARSPSPPWRWTPSPSRPRTRRSQETVGKILGGDATDAAAPVTGLLGGLPTQGLTANGIPLGG